MRETSAVVFFVAIAACAAACSSKAGTPAADDDPTSANDSSARDPASGPAPSTPTAGKDAAMTSNLDRMQRLAPGYTAEPEVGGLSIPGLSFFTLTKAGASAPDDREPKARHVALADDSDQFMEGDVALKIALHLGRGDVMQLALVTAFLVPPVTRVISSADNVNPDDRDQIAGLDIRAPYVDGGVLEFWGIESGGRKETVYRVRVELDSAAVDARPASELAGGGSDAVARAERLVADPSYDTNVIGLDGLVAACDDPRAAIALAAAARKHRNPETRREAVFRMSECANADAVAVLAEVLREDDSAEVRSWAAISLGALADPASRAALEAATADADTSVQRAARDALKKLP